MKRISKKDLQENESYLVLVSLSWSPSGYDICEYRNGGLISQSNSEDVLSFCQEIYELPPL